MPALRGPAILAVTLGIVCMVAAGWAIAGAPLPVTSNAEIFDMAYCQGWLGAQRALEQRSDVIRALYKADEQWKMVREVMDIGECPRAKPRTAGQAPTPPPASTSP